MENVGSENVRLLRLDEVLDIIKLKKSSVYKMMKEGRFPKPIKISRSSRWVLDEIKAWIEEMRRKKNISDSEYGREYERGDFCSVLRKKNDFPGMGWNEERMP